MEIKVTELEKVFSKIIFKLKKEGFDEIRFKNDLYRIIPTEKWNDFEDDSIDVGSLSDDVESLKKLVKNDNIFCSYVDFDRLASILRAISETNNPVS